MQQKQIWDDLLHDPGRECDYSLCLECVNRPRPAIDERQSPPIPQHVAAAPASVTYEAAKLETDAAHPATNEWSDDVNSAAAADAWHRFSGTRSICSGSRRISFAT